MNKNEFIDRLSKALETEDSLLPETKLNDLEEWDSLGNFNLILAVEQKFGVRFDIEDMENLTSIEKIQQTLNNDFSK